MKNKILPALIALFFISIAANIYFFSQNKNSTPSRTNRRSTQIAKYSYLSPQIFVSEQNILINFVALRSSLNTYINATSDLLGSFFEYLPSGVTIGINEKTPYVIASLLKVPVA